MTGKLEGWMARWSAAGGPPPVVVNAKDSSILLYVPAGEFEMGSDSGGSNERSAHRVSLDAYYIGAYCVTNAQYARFVNETGHRAPDKADYGEPVWNGREYPRDKADHPVVCVSWDDASAYAQWSGLSLPTEAQWERAARGPTGLDYPWGKGWEASRCRHDKNRGSEKTAAVHAYPRGVAIEGAYNLSGNVWEWCADWYGHEYYSEAPPENPQGPAQGSDRVNRGGSWNDGDPSYFRSACRFSRVPGLRGYRRGFRLGRQLAPFPASARTAASFGRAGRR